MAEGAWVVLGSIVGVAGTMASTWFTAFLKKKDEDDPYDDLAKQILADQLKLKKWTAIGDLANSVGLNHKLPREYLILLKARGSRKDGKNWGLISENPYSQADA
jgi:hypothetical protein